LSEPQLAHNDPVHQEKTVKFNELLANCAIYSCTLDITTTVNDLTAAGVRVDGEDLATVTPYITSRIRRFGDWKLDLTPPPAGPAALDLAVEA
ncbi:MAG: Tn3 family transposase, partial [Streptosporangiaceae bacterium]